MQSDIHTAPISNGSLWSGRILSAVVVLFMLFDSVIHILRPAAVLDAFARLGYPISLALGLGVLELGLILCYAIPRTAILGAILLTGYLGGAIAANMRVGSPPFETVFPVIVGVLAWGGLFLRDDKLRALIPVRR